MQICFSSPGFCQILWSHTVAGRICQPCVGSSEEDKCLTFGHICEFRCVETLGDAAETVGMVAQVSDALEHSFTHGYHLGQPPILNQDVKQVLSSVRVDNDTLE